MAPTSDLNVFMERIVKCNMITVKKIIAVNLNEKEPQQVYS